MTRLYLLAGGMGVLTALAAVWLAQAAPPETGPHKDSEEASAKLVDQLSLEEQILAQRFQEFEWKLLKLKQRLERSSRPEDQERAAILQKALDKAREAAIGTRFEQMVEFLKNQRLKNIQDVKTAQERSQQLADDLRAILALLREDPRAAKLRDERQRLEKLYKEVERIIRVEKTIQGKTQTGRADPADLQRDQARNAQDTNRLGQEMAKGAGASQTGDRKGPGQGKAVKGQAKGMGQPSDQAGQGKGGDKKGETPLAQAKGGAAKNGDAQGQAKGAGDKSSAAGQAKSGSSGNSAAQSKSGGQSSAPGQAKGGGQGGGGGQAQAKAGGNAGQAGSSKAGNSSPQTAPNDLSRAKKYVEEAYEHERRAEENIAKKNNPEAVKDQDKALERLEKARKQLEQLLRQLREEELERILADLLARCQRMLQMQIHVYEGTQSVQKAIDGNADHQPNRQNKQDALKLADEEKAIILEASKAIQILEEEGSAVAFPEVFHQVREDMRTVQRRLEIADTGKITQATEEDIINTLRDMIKALEKAKQDLAQGKGGGKGGSMRPDQRLLDLLAELKMIRAMQVRVNARTQLYGRQYQGEQASDPNLRRELRGLAERQARIFEVTNRIVRGENQ
jgi:DNA repair exonuclease SbcCD ATPase subunit